MKIALAQLVASDEKRNANKKKQIEAIAQSKKLGADFVLFPEMFDIGYTQPNGRSEDWCKLAISQNHNYIHELKAAYAENEIWGTITYMERGRVRPRNSMLVVNDKGEAVCNYSKVHLYEPFENDASCEPGDEFKVFKFESKEGENIKIGTMICADRDFPEAARVLMKMGAELIISPNACPLNNILSDMLRIRALENAVALATVNYPKPKWDGHSALINPKGEFVERLGVNEEIRVVDLSVSDLKQYRSTTNWGDSYRKEHAYALIISKQIQNEFKDRKNNIGLLRNREEMANKALHRTQTSCAAKL